MQQSLLAKKRAREAQKQEEQEAKARLEQDAEEEPGRGGGPRRALPGAMRVLQDPGHCLLVHLRSLASGSRANALDAELDAAQLGAVEQKGREVLLMLGSSWAELVEHDPVLEALPPPQVPRRD
jgi:hypothetical protein